MKTNIQFQFQRTFHRRRRRRDALASAFATMSRRARESMRKNGRVDDAPDGWSSASEDEAAYEKLKFRFNAGRARSRAVVPGSTRGIQDVDSGDSERLDGQSMFWRRVGASAVREPTTLDARGLGRGTCVALRAVSHGGWFAAKDGSGRTVRANDRPIECGERQVLEFGAARVGGKDEADALRLTARDASTHLVVLRFGDYHGFRSHAAGGRLLQARRKAASDLCFYSENFGVCEQWELVEVDHGRAKSGRAMTFRNRRFPHATLDVIVSVVPNEFLPRYALDDMNMYADDLEYVEFGANESDPESPSKLVQRPLAAPPSPGEMDASRTSMEGAKEAFVTKQVFREEQRVTKKHSAPVTVAKPAESAPKIISAAMAEKWKRKLRSEIDAREGLERELTELAHELELVKASWRKEVQEARGELEAMSVRTVEAVEARKEVEHALERERAELAQELQETKTNWMNEVQAARSKLEQMSVQTVQVVETVRKTMIVRHKEEITSMRATLTEEMRESIRGVQLKAVNRMIQSSSRAIRDRSFIDWKIYVQGARKKRLSIVRFMMRTEVARLGVAFNTWRRHAQHMATMRRKESIVRTRFDVKLARRYFYTWVKTVTEWRETRVIAARAHRRGVRDKLLELMRKVFFAWFSQTKHGKTVANLQLRAIRKMRQKIAFETFELWKQRVFERKVFTRRLMKTFKCWQNRTVRMAFYRWSDVTDRAARERTLRGSMVIKAITQRSDKDVMRRAFTIWRSSWRHISRYLHEHRAKHKFILLNRYFDRWCHAVELRHNMERAIVSKRVTHNLFLDWYWDTFGEEFTRLIESGPTTVERVPVTRFLQSPEQASTLSTDDLFLTPTETPEKVVWSPPRPRRLL